jgi:GH15 family glucan-1,4-alpha-glucosidase
MDRYPPIGDYALIGNCHGAALVARDGSVDWCTFHRFDSRPVFARLLDRARGGFLRVAPVGDAQVTRRYADGTNVLETTFRTARGVVTVVDCMPITTEAGREEPQHSLIRIVRCDEGEAEIELECCPRFDYGLTMPRMDVVAEGLGLVYGGADGLVIDTDFPLAQTELCGCAGTISLRKGERRWAVVRYAEPHLLEATAARRPADVDGLVEGTVRFWRDWTAQCTYAGPFGAAVSRSALVVKALSNAPTGAIVAAPTTSLPEEIGGERNWDYRYVWLRDVAMNLYALYELGYSEEARSFMAWVRRTTAGRVDEVQPVYGIGGEHLIFESEVPGLDGYRGSRPVRIGNAASSQFQLDVYGELLDTAWLYHKHGGEIDPVFWELLRGVVDLVDECWERPDRGIWEVRGEPKHFVSSKVMAWVAVDRGIRLARRLGLPADLDRWRELRRRIRETTERNGVDPRTGAFVRAFGESSLDASALLVPLVRFLPADDPRVKATAARVESELCRDELVYRYVDRDDGVPGGEGAFVICSFWLVDNLAMMGETARARTLFEQILDRANDVGLFAEQIDPATGEPLGNFPQAFSHVGLIGAALNLERAPAGLG